MFIKSRSFRSRTFYVLLICLVLVIVCNYVYFELLTSEEKEPKEVRIKGGEVKIVNDSIAYQIENYYWPKLSFNWAKIEGKSGLNYSHIPNRKLSAISIKNAWKLANGWLQPRQIYTKTSFEIELVLDALSRAKVVAVDVGSGGTQLKLTLHLEGGQKAVFKPMRYTRDTIFANEIYAGADRHNGEIAAFHLSRLLDFRWAPLVVGRKLNVYSEIYNLASNKLKKTFFKKGKNVCFYGVCYYCSKNDAVCSENEFVEGAVIFWIPHQLQTLAHPWRRTYNLSIKAQWEKRDDYCGRVKRVFYKGNRLLDLIDVAIFDFLIGNGDRHRYEVLDSGNESLVLLLDNGKSFGNPFKDEISILAPLYQCCIIRSSTFLKLKSFSEDSLSSSLRTLLEMDALHPVLNEAHLSAIDRRRLKALEVVYYCLKNSKNKNVIW